LARISHFLQQL
jgi:hypothetical protein